MTREAPSDAGVPDELPSTMQPPMDESFPVEHYENLGIDQLVAYCVERRACSHPALLTSAGPGANLTHRVER